MALLSFDNLPKLTGDGYDRQEAARVRSAILSTPFDDGFRWRDYRASLDGFRRWLQIKDNAGEWLGFYHWQHVDNLSKLARVYESETFAEFIPFKGYRSDKGDSFIDPREFKPTGDKHADTVRSEMLATYDVASSLAVFTTRDESQKFHRWINERDAAFWLDCERERIRTLGQLIAIFKAAKLLHL